MLFYYLFICKWWWINYLGWGGGGTGLSAVVCLWLYGFCLGRFPLPLGAWGGLRYFIVALPEPSVWLFSNSTKLDSSILGVITQSFNQNTDRLSICAKFFKIPILFPI